ncbi:uncharacterized protein LOC118466861 [Anopheles albimanus]|uniref:CHHC U11-48K-type domain-containing protein n=1 Tax=Anopheles albimanus TaxID=7167 RepID=A0A182FC33_ANOAL|nr:uncharacterized protein LOC118466861 [Anopheles albimanus]
MEPSAESVIDLLECPYNPAHQLLPHTMARHISKCRRAHGILKLVQCPFNPEHRVPELEMTLHKLECEDRAAFEQYTFCFTTLSSPTTNTTKSPATPTTMRTRRAKEMADLTGYCTSPKSVPAAASRRRTIGGIVPAPVTPLPASEQTLHRVYDLRTSCRQSRKDSLRSPGHAVALPSAIEAVKPLPLIATVSPLRSGKPRYAAEHPLLAASQCEKENQVTIQPKTAKPPNVQKFRTPVKISQRKLSIDDFRKHWKQVHNERRAQSRSKDRSARRSCYT